MLTFFGPTFNVSSAATSIAAPVEVLAQGSCASAASSLALEPQVQGVHRRAIFEELHGPGLAPRAFSFADLISTIYKPFRPNKQLLSQDDQLEENPLKESRTNEAIAKQSAADERARQNTLKEYWKAWDRRAVLLGRRASNRDKANKQYKTLTKTV